MPSPAAVQQKALTHLHYIDALRGIAFLGVPMIHTAVLNPHVRFLNVAAAGQYGVQLFFLLSAITLFRSLNIREKKENHPIRNFYLRRFFRITPLFWVAIVFNYFLNGTGPTGWAPTGLHPWQFVVTSTFTHGWTPSSINSVVPGGWSMAVEMTFYAVLPLLFRYVSSFWTAFGCGVVALIGGAFLSKVTGHILFHTHPPDEHELVDRFINFWFPAQFCVFLFGAAIYHVLCDDRAMASLAGKRVRAAILIATGAYLFVGLAFVGPNVWVPSHVLYILVFASIILGLAAEPFSMAVNPITTGLGTISYSCYLTHFSLLQTVMTHVHPEWFAFFPSFAPEIQFITVFLSTLALTALVSAVTYRLIEQPGIRLGKLLIARGERQPA